MVADPDLLRRPIVAVDGIVLVGFDGAPADPAPPFGRAPHARGPRARAQ
jgi:hypothetical protein